MKTQKQAFRVGEALGSKTIVKHRLVCKNKNSHLHPQNRRVNRQSAAPKSELSDSMAVFEGTCLAAGEAKG